MGSLEITEFPSSDYPPHYAENFITPIDHDRAQQLVVILLEHGAIVRQLDMFSRTVCLPDGRTAEKPVSNHLIRFPLGTLQYDSLVLDHSMSFCIVFPDGFWMRGVSTWGLGEERKTVLYLPKEDTTE